MNKLRKWLYRISGAEDEIRKLKYENEDTVLNLKIELNAERATMEEMQKDIGRHCAHCKNAYKNEEVFYMGRTWKAGYGCKLKIPCEKFEEKEKEE